MGDAGGRRRWRVLARSAGRCLASRPVLLGSVLLALAAAVWFGINLAAPRRPLVLLWVPVPLSLALAAYAVWRTAATPGLSAPTRRFWRHFAIIVVLVAIGSVSYAHDALGGPAASQHISATTLTWYGAAILVIIWAMYRLPVADPTLEGRLRVGLDAGTVVLAAAVFIWHFQTKPLLERDADVRSSILASGVAMVLALLAVFAVVKGIMSAGAHVDRGALQLLALAVVGGALGQIPQTYMRDKPYLLCTQVVIPAIAVCAVLAAERQRSTARRSGRYAPPRRPRPYSVLPYVAVFAVDVLLVGLAGTARYDDLAVISLGAVALTALVIVRQLRAFQENGRLLARLDHNATHDALTRLPNRALFEQRLNTALAAGDRTGQVCVALLDLNDFKLVNDTLGHGVGDALLVALAPRLVAGVRSRDTVARLGGDEFVVVFDDIERADVDRIARRMIDALTEPVVADGHKLAVRASIGLATGGCDEDARELLRRADVAMYAAKSLGKNTGTSHFVHYGPELDNPAAGVSKLLAV